MLSSLTIFGLSTIFGLLTFLAFVAIFNDVTTLALATIGDLRGIDYVFNSFNTKVIF